MSVDETNVIDFIGIEKETGWAKLAISDHLDWSDEEEHLLSVDYGNMYSPLCL